MSNTVTHVDKNDTLDLADQANGGKLLVAVLRHIKCYRSKKR